MRGKLFVRAMTLVSNAWATASNEQNQQEGNNAPCCSQGQQQQARPVGPATEVIFWIGELYATGGFLTAAAPWAAFLYHTCVSLRVTKAAAALTKMWQAADRKHARFLPLV